MVSERESRFKKVDHRIILQIDLVYCPRSHPETEGESKRSIRRIWKIKFAEPFKEITLKHRCHWIKYWINTREVRAKQNLYPNGKQTKTKQKITKSNLCDSFKKLINSHVYKRMSFNFYFQQYYLSLRLENFCITILENVITYYPIYELTSSQFNWFIWDVQN